VGFSAIPDNSQRPDQVVVREKIPAELIQDDNIACFGSLDNRSVLPPGEPAENNYRNIIGPFDCCSSCRWRGRIGWRYIIELWDCDHDAVFVSTLLSFIFSALLVYDSAVIILSRSPPLLMLCSVLLELLFASICPCLLALVQLLLLLFLALIGYASIPQVLLSFLFGNRRQVSYSFKLRQPKVLLTLT